MDPLTVSALIGAGSQLVGGVAGGVGAVGKADATKKELQELARLSKEQKEEIARRTGVRVSDLDALYGTQLEGFDTNTKAYFDSLKNADYDQFNISAPGDFDFDIAAETQRQLNPELQAIIDRSTGAVTQSAANAGKLFSGAAGKAIARSTADIQAKEWDAAATRAQQARTNKYQEYIDKFNNATKVAEFNRGNYTSGMGTKKELFGTQSQIFGDKTGMQQDLLNSGDTAQQKLQSDINAATAKAKGTQTGFGAFLQGFAGGLGASPSTES